MTKYLFPEEFFEEKKSKIMYPGNFHERKLKKTSYLGNFLGENKNRISSGQFFERMWKIVSKSRKIIVVVQLFEKKGKTYLINGELKQFFREKMKKSDRKMAK